MPDPAWQAARHGRHPVTMKDVAAYAGTSIATVSYVVNDGPRPVSAATREKVERAVRELGYRVNGSARTLRSRRSGRLGIVVPNIEQAVNAQIVSRASEICLLHNYVLLVGASHDDLIRESSYLGRFLEHQVDGILLVGPVGAVMASGVTSNKIVSLPKVESLDEYGRLLQPNIDTLTHAVTRLIEAARNP